MKKPESITGTRAKRLAGAEGGGNCWATQFRKEVDQFETERGPATCLATKQIRILKCAKLHKYKELKLCPSSQGYLIGVAVSARDLTPLVSGIRQTRISAT